MKSNKIEIRLEYIEDSEVSLEKMSLQAFESFITVANSLKNIAETVSDKITITIKKGSAYTSVNGNANDIKKIYTKIDEAVKGESEDEIITQNLRIIQKEIQNQALDYQFFYSNINIGTKIKTAKKIVKKRGKNLYQNQLEILTGFFNSIGGNEPNYHFDYGHGNRKTIECSKEDAIELKNYLYQTITCIVQKKSNKNNKSKINYQHCSIIKHDQIEHYRTFINRLNETCDLLERLELIYDFLDNSKSRIDDMSILLKSYKYFFEDINEYKTLLILSKNFKNNPIIKNHREILLNDFETQMIDF